MGSRIPKNPISIHLTRPMGESAPIKGYLERGDPLCWVPGCLYSPSRCTVLTLRRARKWRHRGSTDFLLAPPHYLFHTSKSICCGFENLHFPLLDTFGIRVLRYPEKEVKDIKMLVALLIFLVLSHRIVAGM